MTILSDLKVLFYYRRKAYVPSVQLTPVHPAAHRQYTSFSAVTSQVPPLAHVRPAQGCGVDGGSVGAASVGAASVGGASVGGASVGGTSVGSAADGSSTGAAVEGVGDSGTTSPSGDSLSTGVGPLLPVTTSSGVLSVVLEEFSAGEISDESWAWEYLTNCKSGNPVSKSRSAKHSICTLVTFERAIQLLLNECRLKIFPLQECLVSFIFERCWEQ